MPHEKGQGAASSLDNKPTHSWLGAVELAASQLRGLGGFALGTSHLPNALSVLVVLAGYYAGGIVGIQLGFPPSGVAAMWPSTAILLAALLLAPPRFWWAYLLGVVPTHLHLVANFQVPDVPVVVMLCQVASNVLHVVLAALALRFVIGTPPQLTSLRNMGAFILLAGVVATGVACVVAVWLFLLTGWANDFWLVWRQRTLANVFAIVTIPPVIVSAFAGQLVGVQHATWRSYSELALITMGVLVLGIPVFGLEPPGPSNVPALLLMPLPFLMWAAVRVGVGGTSLTLLIVAGIALANAYVGRGPFINQAPDVNVFSLQIFLTAISIPLLLLAALVEERRQAEEALNQTSKQAELALAERSLQLALAGKAALVGSYAYDVDMDMMQIDAGYAALHGLPEGTVQTTRSEWRARAHPDDVVRVEDMREKAFAEGLGEFATEYRIVRSGGEVRWIETRSFIAYTSEGRAQRIAGVNIDVTERRRTEQALIDRNNQIALSGKTALVGSFAIQIDPTREHTAQIVRVSPGLAAILGLAAETEEISGGDWRSRVYPADLPQVLALRHQAMVERRSEHHMEYRIVRPCGTIRWIESRTTIEYDEAGQPSRLVGVNIDITERKKLEEQRKALIGELDHRVKNALSTVNAVISHTAEGSRTLADFVAALDGRIRSMATTHELLSAHRWQGISLRRLIESELAPFATGSNTELEGPEVILTPEAGQAMAMVLHELVTNAAKYGALSTHQGGRVMIRWDRRLNGHPRSHLVLEWQETGGPPVIASPRSSYGMSVIRDLLPYEFGAAVDLVLSPEGVCCRVGLPNDWLSNGADPVSEVKTDSALRTSDR